MGRQDQSIRERGRRRKRRQPGQRLQRKPLSQPRLKGNKGRRQRRGWGDEPFIIIAPNFNSLKRLPEFERADRIGLSTDLIAEVHGEVRSGLGDALQHGVQGVGITVDVRENGEAEIRKDTAWYRPQQSRHHRSAGRAQNYASSVVQSLDPTTTVAFLNFTEPPILSTTTEFPQ